MGGTERQCFLAATDRVYGQHFSFSNQSCAIVHFSDSSICLSLRFSDSVYLISFTDVMLHSRLSVTDVSPDDPHGMTSRPFA